MPDLHRHDHFSLFDGAGKPKDLAKLAKDKGYTALGISNHGTISGIVQHYIACKQEEIKPILGVEVYFQTKFKKERKRNHLCLYIKNIEGYRNLNRLMYLAEKQKFYKPIITFKELAKYNEGIICTSACVGGPIAQLFLQGKEELAIKAITTLKQIFSENFYIELQPYKIDSSGTQEKVNEFMMKMANKFGIKCILTSDSHFGSKEEFDTYQIMHKVANNGKGFSDDEVTDTYGERYMPSYDDLIQRFVVMHGDKNKAKEMIKNLKEIEDKVDGDVLDKLPLVLPKLYEDDSNQVLKNKLLKGLEFRGKSDDKKYKERMKQEFKIIQNHGFSDYFLIVQDFTLWAKKQGIGVGPGRGSVCNSLVAYLLGITDVDSVYFDLDFKRFLREDKKKLPDIDMDFETARRHEVIDYMMNKYKNKSAQVGSYGLYRVDNLINDLVKVCGVIETHEVAGLKKFIKNSMFEDTFNYNEIKKLPETKQYNRQYNNIIKHFSNLFMSVRYLGTHAAGVVITGENLLNYSAIRLMKDKETGVEKKATVFDLLDAEAINMVKFDILGLKTTESLNELKKLTGEVFDYSWLEDKKVIEAFRKGDTDGIFQFEKKAAKEILVNIDADCFDDVCAASSMNRPGPLQMNMPQIYAENKMNSGYIHNEYYEYTKETYGTIVYQEQLMQICRNIGNMSWEGTDKVMKMMKAGSMTEAAKQRFKNEYEGTKKEFVTGAVSNGMTKKDAAELFEKLVVYTFNKGHAVGYTMISFEEMYYKVHHTTDFWYMKIKCAGKEEDEAKYKINAVANGDILLIPHVNATALTSLTTLEGSKAIQEGMSSLKFVGEKAAEAIEAERRKNGKYKDEEDFINRNQKRAVNSRTVEVLKQYGALEFNKKVYFERVKKYNSTLFMKGLNK